MELGKKLIGGYQLGKKILDSAVSMGEKIRNVVRSAPVQSVIGMLPAQIQGALQVAGALGERALNLGQSLQQKINSGEALAKRVDSSVRSVELPRQSMRNQPDIMEQGSSIRIPDRLVTGGDRSQRIPMTVGGPSGPIMTF